MDGYTDPTTQGMVSPTAQPMDMANSSEFLAKINQIPEPQRSQFLAQLSKDYAGQGALLKEDMGRAEALRDTPTPQGRTSRNGIYTAANPLEHIGAGMSRYAGQRDMAKARKAQGGLSNSLGTANRSLLDILRGNTTNPLEYAP